MKEGKKKKRRKRERDREKELKPCWLEKKYQGILPLAIFLIRKYLKENAKTNKKKTKAIRLSKKYQK